MCLLIGNISHVIDVNHGPLLFSHNLLHKIQRNSSIQVSFLTVDVLYVDLIVVPRNHIWIFRCQFKYHEHQQLSYSSSIHRLSPWKWWRYSISHNIPAMNFTQYSIFLLFDNFTTISKKNNFRNPIKATQFRLRWRDKRYLNAVTHTRERGIFHTL